MDSPSIVKVTAEWIASLLNTGSQTIYLPTAVAVDGAGNAYIADLGALGVYGSNRVVEVTPDGTSSVVNTGGGISIDGPGGVAVDGAGNVYITDEYQDRVVEVFVGGIVNILDTAEAAGILISDNYKNRIVEVTTGGMVRVLNTGSVQLLAPEHVAVDGAENVYIADSLNSHIVKIDRADAPSLSFAATNISATSSDSPQTTAVENIGNVELTFAPGNNPSYPTDFPVNTADTNLCAAGTSLASGATCDVSINFLPSTTGSLTESVGLTDNNLNVTNATQAIQLSGTGLTPTITDLELASPNPVISYGQPEILTAFVTEASPGGLGPAPFGLVTFYEGSTVLGTASLSPTNPNSSVAQFTWIAMPLGQDTLTATYAPGQGSGFGGSSGVPLTLNVSPDPTSTTLSATPNPLTLSQLVTLTATVTSMLDGSPADGPVTFVVGDTTLDTVATVGGSAQLTTNALPAGTDTVLAVFLPPNGSIWSPSQGSFIETVRSTVQSTVTTLTSSSNSVASGSPVTLTATVTASGSPVSPGLVTFCDATAKYCESPAVLGTAQLTDNGTASIRLFLGIGPHSIKARFGGTNSEPTSSSTPQVLTVTGTHPTVTRIVSAGSAGDYTLTATVAGGGDTATAPTGNVSFLDASDGNAVLRTATLGAWTTAQKFDAEVTYAVGNGPLSVAVGDFNGDGKPDLAVTNQSDASVSVLLGNGDGSFQNQVTYATGANPGSIAVGDFNGDGKLDLAVANLDDNTLSVLLGKGDGTFQNQATYVTGDEPGSVAVGDFNGDGKPDLVVANRLSGILGVLLGNGDGTFQSQTIYEIGPTAGSIAVGDFNGDGKLDLAVANIIDNTLSVSLGNGDGTFQSQVTYTTGQQPFSVAVGDFNGDGKLDLAVVNSLDNTLGVLLGNGDGTFQSQVTYATGKSPVSVVVGDFNGDGKPDLAVANNGGNTVGVLLDQVTQTATATSSNLSVPGSGTHYVRASYPGDMNYSLSVSGTIPLVAWTPQAIALSSYLLGFDDQPVGTIGPPEFLSLTNKGASPLTLGAITTSGDFALPTTPRTTCHGKIASGSSCYIYVVFKPTGTGLRTGLLTIHDSVLGNPQTVKLEAHGIGVLVSPAYLVWRLPRLDMTGPRKLVRVSNVSSDTLSLSFPSITPYNARDIWTVTPSSTNGCHASLPAGGSCTYAITLSLRKTGFRFAKLSIMDRWGKQDVVLECAGTIAKIPIVKAPFNDPKMGAAKSKTFRSRTSAQR